MGAAGTKWRGREESGTAIGEEGGATVREEGRAAIREKGRAAGGWRGAERPQLLYTVCEEAAVAVVAPPGRAEALAQPGLDVVGHQRGPRERRPAGSEGDKRISLGQLIEQGNQLARSIRHKGAHN